MNKAAAAIVERFESLEMQPGSFSHRDHVVAGWAMLEVYPLFEATTRFAAVLREFVARVGAPDKYNATITVAFLTLIAERMQRREYSDADEFCDSNPDLLDPHVLHRYYEPESLTTELARAAFVVPERVPTSVSADSVS